MGPEDGTENGDEMETSGKGEAPDIEANPYPRLSDYAKEQPDGTEHFVEVIYMDAGNWWTERWHICFWKGETYTRKWHADGDFWNICTEIDPDGHGGRPRCGGHGGHTEDIRCSGSYF